MTLELWTFPLMIVRFAWKVFLIWRCFVWYLRIITYQKKNVLNINDLEGEDFVSFSLGTYLRHEIDLILAKNGVNCRTKLETRSQTDIYQYVKHGAGVSLVFPFNQFEHTSFPGLLFKPLNIDFKMSNAVIRSKRRKPSLATQNFIRVVKKLVESWKTIVFL